MSGDRMDALIKAIIGDAARENVHIKPDDPVIVLAVIMNRVIEDQSAAIMAMLDQYREEHAVLAHQWRDDAKGSANIILNSALAAARDSMGQAMDEGARKVVALVSESTARAVAEQKAAGEATVTEMKRLATWMLAATGASLVAAVLLAVLL
jgi:hypothetical protein